MGSVWPFLMFFGLISRALSSCLLDSLPAITRPISSEIKCALACHLISKCFSYHFRDTNSSMNSTEKKCILLSGYPCSGKLNPPADYHHQIAIQSSLPITKFARSRSNLVDLAISKGFNLTLQVRNTTFYMKKIPQVLNHHEAEVHCFTQGGILPMEDSHEFIEAMSDLVGNDSTTRFVSLVRETLPDTQVRHLSWTLGPKEWGEDENGATCSKYSDWPTSHLASRSFVVNPITKTFEPIAWSGTKDNIYCQFLGLNLATNKSTLASSVNRKYPKHFATNGIVFDGRCWISDNGNEGESNWIVIDLERSHAIRHVLFINRHHRKWGYRNKVVKVWIGSRAPIEATPLHHEDFIFCGVYPYQQSSGFLSGVTCSRLILGQFVALENYPWAVPMQIEEIGVFEDFQEF